MRAALDGKDPVALEGLTLALDAVDVIFNSLIEEVQIRARQIESDVRRDPALSARSAATGKLLRLTVQRQTIEVLRAGIPAVILYGDASKLRGAVG